MSIKRDVIPMKRLIGGKLIALEIYANTTPKNCDNKFMD